MKKNTVKKSDVSAVKKISMNRSMRHGAYAVAITAVVVVGIILLNWAATAVDRYFDNKVDFTENQIFTISKESEEYLKTVKNEIVIKVLSAEEDFENGQGPGGNVYKHLHAVLNKYRAMCSKIKIEYLNPSTNPRLALDYPNDMLSWGDFIVEGVKPLTDGARPRYKVIKMQEMLAQGSEDGSMTISMSEQLITSAILFIDDPEPVSVGVVIGHEEKALDYFSKLLVTNNYESVPINILGEIPENMRFLIINSPKKDFTEEEIDILEKFLENGGEYGRNIIYTGYVSQGETPNLDAFLASWGLAIDTENVLYETDTSGVYAGTNPNMPILSVVESDLIASSFDYTGQRAAADSYVHSVETLFTQQAGKTVTPLLKTTPTVVLQPYGELANASINKWSPAGLTRKEMNVGVVSQFDKTDSSGTVSSSRVFAFGGEGMLADGVMTYQVFCNPQLFLDVIANCTGKQDIVQIAPKQIGTTTLGADKNSEAIITAVFVVAVPLAVVAVGIVIFVRRRKL